MQQKRKLTRRLTGSLAVFITLVAAVGVGRPATALDTRLYNIGSGLSACPAGYVCLWTLDNFTGTGYAFYNSETGGYANLPAPFNGIDKNSWSFYNNGNSYDIRFARTGSFGGDTFILCKKAWIASLQAKWGSGAAGVPPKPTSAEPGRDWRDQVTMHKFGSFC